MGSLRETYRRTKETFLRKGFGARTVANGVNRSSDSGETLRAVLGARDLTLLGVGAIVGAGVFVLTGEAAREFAGPSIILSYFLSSLAAILLALSYVEFAVDFPVTGGAFNYIRLVQGEFIAWQAGACLILEYTLGSAAVSKGFSGYLASLFGQGTGTFVFEAWIFNIDLMAFGMITFLAALLYFGTKESAWFNLVVTAVNLAVIVFIISAAAAESDGDHFSPFTPYGTRGAFRAAAVVFFSYIGFDSLVTVAAEVKNPKRDLPVSVVGSITICTVLYMLMATALIGLQAYNEIDATAPYSEAFVAMGMRWAGRIVSLGALTGIVTSVLVQLLGLSRILVALGREKLLPPWIGKIDPKHATPKNALLFNWTCSGVLSLLFDIDILSRVVSMGTLFVLGLVSLAAIQRTYAPEDAGTTTPWPLLVRLAMLVGAAIVEGAAFALEAHPAVYGIALGITLLVSLSFYRLPVTYTPENFVAPFKPLTPCAAVLAAVHLMFSLGWEAHLLFLIWLMVGWAIYLAYGMHHTAEPTELPSPKQLQLQQVPNGSHLLTGIAERSDNPLEH